MSNKPFLRIAPSTLSVAQLRQRIDALAAQHRDLDVESLELEAELYERTNGADGLDRRVYDLISRLRRNSTAAS